MIQKIGCILSGASRDTYTPHQRCKLLLFIDVHWAHNPKVVGSNPTPSTNKKGHSNRVAFFVCLEIGVES